jgi:hypothetical protein
MKQSMQLSCMLEIAATGINDLVRVLPAGQHVMVTSRKMRTAALYIYLYTSLLEAAGTDTSLADPDFIARWDAAIHEYVKLDPMYAYIERLLMRRDHLKQTLQGMRQSRLWKLMAPLRWVDDTLRAQRKRKHLQRRAVTS